MKIYNTAPYFDDFDENKGFHQILFKPGFAVQARELTQLQTILQKQIERFGNHVFKHGSVVIPGNSFAELNAPYVKIASLNNTSLLPSAFESKVVVGLTTGIRAVVKKTVAATPTDPIVFYLGYLSGAGATGGVTFQAGEQIYIEDAPGIVATVATGSYSGFGALASVNAGVYYINGYFVYTPKQTIVFDKFSNQPSGSVVFKITEAIISSTDDETLLDPAQGSYNYAAPGADRLEVSLDLEVLPLTSPINQDYVELMRYDSGELLEHSRYPKYSELEKSLARRTFDESGNYVVDGFQPKVREHLRLEQNGGVYSDPVGDKDKLVVEVAAGKAYISGFEVEKLSRTRIEINKARTAEHINSRQVRIRPQYGQYIYVSDIQGAFSAQDRTLITFKNDTTVIGTAKIIAVDYVSTLSAVAGIYKLWVVDVTLSSGRTLEEAMTITYNVNDTAKVIVQYTAPVTSGAFESAEIVSNASGRTATVKYYNPVDGQLYVYKHDSTKLVPRVGELIVGGTSDTQSTTTSRVVLVSIGQTSMLFSLPVNVAATLKNQALQYDLEYTVQKELDIVANASGIGSATISSGTIDPIEDGTFLAIGETGAIPNNLFGLNVDGNTLSFSGGITYANAVIKVFANVTKTNVFPKTKTLTTFSETFNTPGNVITLSKTDIVEVVSVIDTVGDITVNYTLNNGQSDYVYNRGSLSLKGGRSAPVGAVTVTYRYYEHSISGDFFCVDSYASTPDYMDKLIQYSSQTTGQNYNLLNAIDFRPSVGSDGLMTGPNARTNDIVGNDTIFRTNVQYYMGRIDSLVVDASSNLSIISGRPSDSPKSPQIPEGKFEIGQFDIPPYTQLASGVRYGALDVNRHTMSDISKIVRRVERVEDFTTLTLDESSLTSFEVIDAETGLSRYKTGYLVENFANPLLLARKTSSDFSASFIGGAVTARKEKLNVSALLSAGSQHYTIANNFITLPYTEEKIFGQSFSSRLTNVNPFLIIKWDGLLEVIPPVDNWVERRDLATIYETNFNDVRVTRYVSSPPPVTAPARAAQSTPTQINKGWRLIPNEVELFKYLTTGENAAWPLFNIVVTNFVPLDRVEFTLTQRKLNGDTQVRNLTHYSAREYYGLEADGSDNNFFTDFLRNIDYFSVTGKLGEPATGDTSLWQASKYTSSGVSPTNDSTLDNADASLVVYSQQ
jgi:hypothetical protein